MTNAQSKGVGAALAGAIWVHHGDCIGSDKQANDIAHCRGLKVVVHPPTNPSNRAFCNGHIIHPPKDYIRRNHDIVDATERLVAAPATMSEELRSGTWATVRYARRTGKPVSLVFPNGSVQL